MVFASPIAYITSDDPPFLLVHGVDDRLVPIRQSEIFFDALQSAGIETEFIRVQGAGHSFKPSVKNQPISPTTSEIAEYISTWFIHHLQ
jgi:dipeptidyl aminopeptidase/acylaminoacyl peptidase